MYMRGWNRCNLNQNKLPSSWKRRCLYTRP